MPWSGGKEIEHMANTTISAPSGIGLPGAMFLVFLVLKLTGTITWSWWWVTSPLWITAVSVIAIVLMALVVAIFMDVFNGGNHA